MGVLHSSMFKVLRNKDETRIRANQILTPKIRQKRLTRVPPKISARTVQTAGFIPPFSNGSSAKKREVIAIARLRCQLRYNVFGGKEGHN